MDSPLECNIDLEFFKCGKGNSLNYQVFAPKGLFSTITHTSPQISFRDQANQEYAKVTLDLEQPKVFGQVAAGTCEFFGTAGKSLDKWLEPRPDDIRYDPIFVPPEFLRLTGDRKYLEFDVQRCLV